MPDRSKEYVETTDLYLQILWEAQKVEDKKLVKMIRKRLTQNTPQILQAGFECEVIPFPRPFVPPVTVAEEPQIWPQNPVFQTLFVASCYAWLIVAGLMG